MIYWNNYEKIVVRDVQKSLAVLKDKSTPIGIDTETYGLAYDDKMFSLILTCESHAFYYNFYDGEDFLGNKSEVVLNKYETLGLLHPIFSDPFKIWASHNAKFDLHKLANDNVYLQGQVHCTYATERVLQNDHNSYSLDECAKRRGWHKDDAVEAYVTQNKLYHKHEIPGKKRGQKAKQYYKVPFGIISNYGLNDGILHREICLDQLERLHALK